MSLENVEWDKIVTALSAVFGVVLAVYGFFRNLERRLTTLETWRGAVNERIEQQDERIDHRLKRIEDNQDEILRFLYNRHSVPHGAGSSDLK